MQYNRSLLSRNLSTKESATCSSKASFFCRLLSSEKSDSLELVGESRLGVGWGLEGLFNNLPQKPVFNTTAVLAYASCVC